MDVGLWVVFVVYAFSASPAMDMPPMYVGSDREECESISDFFNSNLIEGDEYKTSVCLQVGDTYNPEKDFVPELEVI